MFEFTVKVDGGDTYQVTAVSRDVFAWEKTHRAGKTFAQLMNDLALVDLYKIAYLASKRAGLWDGTQADFEAMCDLDVNPQEEPDPTRSGRSTGDSSSSRSRPASPQARGPKKANARSSPRST